MAVLIRRRDGPRPSPDSMTLGEHLAELRRRLVISLVVFAGATVGAYLLYNAFLALLEQPYCQALSLRAGATKCDLVVTGPIDGFAMRLNVAGYGGLVLASPVILWQLWKFVTPGLKANEKKYAVPFVAATVGLFLLGSYAAWLAFPHALHFLINASGPHVVQLLTVQKYVSLILALMAIFGLTFEFPVVLVALELAGVLTPQRLVKSRRFAIMAIVIVAAVVTPSSDPFSMLAMAVPMLVFYEASILIGKVLLRRRPVEA